MTIIIALKVLYTDLCCLHIRPSSYLDLLCEMILKLECSAKKKLLRMQSFNFSFSLPAQCVPFPRLNQET